MKELIFLILVFASLFTTKVTAQNHEIRISGDASHHIPKTNTSIPSAKSDNFINTAGIELGYFKSLSNNWKIGTTLFYQWNTFYREIDRKYKCNEGGFSFLFKKSLLKTKNGNSGLISSFGIYNGLIYDVQVYMTHRNSEEWLHSDGFWLYTEDFNERFFSDLYFDLEWMKTLDNFGYISMSPFLKYRIKKTWVNENYSRFQFGLKLNFSFYIK